MSKKLKSYVSKRNWKYLPAPKKYYEKIMKSQLPVDDHELMIDLYQHMKLMSTNKQITGVKFSRALWLLDLILFGDGE